MLQELVAVAVLTSAGRGHRYHLVRAAGERGDRHFEGMHAALAGPGEAEGMGRRARDPPRRQLEGDLAFDRPVRVADQLDLERERVASRTGGDHGRRRGQAHGHGGHDHDLAQGVSVGELRFAAAHGLARFDRDARHRVAGDRLRGGGSGGTMPLGRVARLVPVLEDRRARVVRAAAEGSVLRERDVEAPRGHRVASEDRRQRAEGRSRRPSTPPPRS